MQEYVKIGDIQVNSVKLNVAKKAKNAYKMGRKILPEFFTAEELMHCTTVTPKNSKTSRQPINKSKLDDLLCE